MSYENTVEFEGDFNKALEAVRNTLLPHGFKIINNDDTSIELEGPDTLFTKGQDPLKGISWIHIQSSGDSLIVKADFGGIVKSMKYATVFIVGMAVFFFILFGILFHKEGTPAQKYLLPIAPLILWPFILPIMAKIMKKMATKSIDTLINNMVTLGQQK